MTQTTCISDMDKSAETCLVMGSHVHSGPDKTVAHGTRKTFHQHTVLTASQDKKHFLPIVKLHQECTIAHMFACCCVCVWGS